MSGIGDFDPPPDTDPQVKLDRLALEDFRARLITLEQQVDELRKLVRSVLKLDR